MDRCLYTTLKTKNTVDKVEIKSGCCYSTRDRVVLAPKNLLIEQRGESVWLLIYESVPSWYVNG